MAQSGQPALTWAPCGDVPDTECARLQVPVDYANPDGAKFTLRLGRAPALDPAKRKGVLLILPGGPGAGILETIVGDMRDGAAHPRVSAALRCRHLRPARRRQEQPDPLRSQGGAQGRDADGPPADPGRVRRGGGAPTAPSSRAAPTPPASCSGIFPPRTPLEDIERIRQALSPNDGIVAYGRLLRLGLRRGLSRNLSAAREGAGSRCRGRPHHRLRPLPRAQRLERAGFLRAHGAMVRRGDQMRRCMARISAPPSMRPSPASPGCALWCRKCWRRRRSRASAGRS